jgi:hypothetical protein
MVVMECAGRALSFWSYQMTNQMSVQSHAGLLDIGLLMEAHTTSKKTEN